MEYQNWRNGLSKEEVEKRKNQNLVNFDTSVPTKSIGKIIRENFITLFNILNLVLAIAVFAVGSYKNALFMIIIITNTAISTIQEIHSKKMVDKLAVLASQKASVIRDGEKQEISIHEIVLDDIIEFKTGNQVPVDGKIKEGNVEVDESFITGESDTIYKKAGDTIFSGSIIVSGKCIAQVEHVGEDNYTSQISMGAKYVKKVKSEMTKSLSKIIRVLTYTIVPVGILLFCNQYFHLHATIQQAVEKTVAAMIGMIPEGLVLLTSTVFMVSVIRMSKQKVLVQELYCIETLARVDTLCLDKTGTLTEGKMEVKKFSSLSQEFENIVANIANSSEDTNATINAIKDKFNKVKNAWKKVEVIPFSSETKFSAVLFKEQGTYILGAPEIVLHDKINDFEKELSEADEYRILAIIHTDTAIGKKELPKEYDVVGFLYLKDKIRKEAKDTLKYFKDQGVDIKIISGDNPITVSQIAKRVGMENYDKYIDLSTIETQYELKEAAIKYSIFGRVTPMQKKELISELKANGRTVAMTGDGVNDVLALKEADCSIAMANGSDATKNVSQLILMDSNFASMPKVVLEGRRSINNLERSASLFLVKTIYSAVLSVIFIILGELYPFMPIQLSAISTITIGVPSFFLALEYNKDRIQGNFLQNVIRKALPTALTVIISILAIAISHKIGRISDEIYSSLCVIAAGFSEILLLYKIAKKRKSENNKLPFSEYRFTIATIMTILFIVELTVFSWLFSIAPIEHMKVQIVVVCTICIICFSVLNCIMNKKIKK